MAEVRKVVVEVVAAETGDGQPNHDINEEIDKNQPSANKSVFDKEKFKQYAKEQLNRTKEIAVGFATSEFNRYVSLSEDYLAENTYNQVTSTISAARRAYSSIKSGATTGMSFGGPWGAAIGAVVGVAEFGITTAVDYRKKMSSYNKQLNETNITTAYQAGRMNLIDGGQNTSN